MRHNYSFSVVRKHRALICVVLVALYLLVSRQKNRVDQHVETCWCEKSIGSHPSFDSNMIFSNSSN